MKTKIIWKQATTHNFVASHNFIRCQRNFNKMEAQSKEELRMSKNSLNCVRMVNNSCLELWNLWKEQFYSVYNDDVDGDKENVKVKLLLCLLTMSWRLRLQTEWCKASLMFNLGARVAWVASFRIRSFYPRYPKDRRLGVPVSVWTQ